MGRYSRSRSRSRSRSPRRGRRRERSADRYDRDRRRDRSPYDRRRRRSRSSSPKKRRGSRLESVLQTYSRFLEENRNGSVDDYDLSVVRFQNRVSRIFYDEHKTEPWLREDYHPESLETQYAAQAKAVEQRANEWKERAMRGEVAETSYDASNKPELLKEDGEPIQSESILFVTGVSCKASFSKVRQMLEKAGGGEESVTSCVVSQPLPENGYTRSCWVEFSAPEAAAKCLADTDGALLEGSPLKVVFASLSSSQPALLPPFAASAKRLEQDSKQASLLASIMDTYFGLTPTAGLEGDLAIRYLREVHLFCYYSATQYQSEAELKSRCREYYRVAPAVPTQEEGSIPLPAVVADFDSKGEAWGEALDFNILAQINKCQQKQLDEHLGKKDVEKSVEALKASSFEVDAEDRYRCLECSKLFMTKEYVLKHFANKHQDLIAQRRVDALEERGYRNYLADVNHIVTTDNGQSSKSSGNDNDRPYSDASSSSYYDRKSRRQSFPPGPPPPVPADAKEDPREIRSYQGLVAMDLEDEEEVDYRLM